MLTKVFDNVFSIGGRLLTENLTPGVRVYNEKFHKIENKQYREWNPYRSKLAAAIKNGLKNLPIKTDQNILYLGASTGTTVSHISDIAGKDANIFCVEISPTSMKSLLRTSEKRENLFPILADARKPETYAEVEKVDLIYQDVAQPDQEDILIINAQKFLKKKGIALFCIKSQCIDVLKQPKETFEQIKKKLKDYFEILEEIRLEPYDKDHLFLVLRKK